jgi:hypothetical protein
MKCTRRKQSKNQDLQIGNLEIGQVRSFKYLGAIVNAVNSIEEEIKERIPLGNKALFKQKNVSK